MRLLWLYLFFQTVSGRAGFGSSYLEGSRLDIFTSPKTTDDTGGVYNFYTLPETTTAEPTTEYSQTSSNYIENNELQDPMDCCEMDEFIQPNWRTECDFKLKWDLTDRITIQSNNEIVSSTTEKVSLKHSDVRLVPTSCEKEQCIFGKLNIVSDNGVVDKDAFGKLLDNMTNLHPIWTKAKARVVTQCLARPLLGYEGTCEINKILTCTFDILSENCPYTVGDDACVQRNTTTKEGVICQISSSIYRPRHRRRFCGFPTLVDREVLSECGETSISRLDYVSNTVPKPRSFGRPADCKELTRPTSCLLDKMGVLNKYGFMDYFKMIEKLRAYSDGLTSNLYKLYNSALQESPLYTDHCTSPKKLLNVLDTMLMTCPWFKRKTNQMCNRIFSDYREAAPSGKLDQMTEHFKHVYFPIPTKPAQASTHKSTIKDTVLYDFGILGSKNAPPVETIDLRPQNKTLVLLPVYQRMPKDPLALASLHNDDVLRG